MPYQPSPMLNAQLRLERQMNKNPFEVRLDVMKMAQDMLDKEQDVKMAKFDSAVRAMQMDKTPSNIIISYIDKSAPTMYSSEDILSKASELYNFVNTSTSRSGTPPADSKK